MGYDVTTYGFGGGYSTPESGNTYPGSSHAPGTGFANIAGGISGILGSGGLVGLIDEIGDMWSISKGGQADPDANDPALLDPSQYKPDNGGGKDHSTTYLIIGAIVAIGILYFMNKK